MSGQIKSSKPTLSEIPSTIPHKSVLSVNREGVLMERGGPIYMTSYLSKCGSCDDIFLPVVYIDSYGNLMPVIQSSVDIDNYGGVPFVRNNI